MGSVPVALSQSEFNHLATAWSKAAECDIHVQTHDSFETTTSDPSKEAVNYARAIEFISCWDVQLLAELESSVGGPSLVLTATFVPDTSHEVSLLICLHPVYQVPVLYFDTRLLDGTPLSFAEVLEWLPDSISDEHKRLTRDFGPANALLSQAEHPITHLPSWTIHPCCTAEWMQGFDDDVSTCLQLPTPPPATPPVVPSHQSTTATTTRNSGGEHVFADEAMETIVRMGKSISLVDDSGKQCAMDNLSSADASSSPSSNSAQQGNIAKWRGRDNSNRAPGLRRDSLLLSWFSVLGPVVHVNFSASLFAQLVRLNRVAYEKILKP